MPELTLDPKYDDYDFPTVSATNQPGHAGHLTKEQEAHVHQLRTMLEQAGYSERLDTLTLVGQPAEKVSWAPALTLLVTATIPAC